MGISLLSHVSTTKSRTKVFTKVGKYDIIDLVGREVIYIYIPCFRAIVSRPILVLERLRAAFN